MWIQSKHTEHTWVFLSTLKNKIEITFFFFYIGKYVYTYGAFDISFLEINASIRFGIVEIRRIPERRKSWWKIALLFTIQNSTSNSSKFIIDYFILKVYNWHFFSVITIDLSGFVPRRQYQFRGMFDWRRWKWRRTIDSTTWQTSIEFWTDFSYRYTEKFLNLTNFTSEIAIWK